MQHALAQEEEKELWRLLDAHGRGSVNLDTFKARYRAWPKSTHAGVGRGGRDTGGGGGAGNAKAAGAFVKDQAWRRRCTMHELFDALDLGISVRVSLSALPLLSLHLLAVRTT